MTKKKKRYTAKQKIIILKRHFVDRVAVSDMCDEYHIFPTIFTVGRNNFLKEELLRSKANTKIKKPEKKWP